MMFSRLATTGALRQNFRSLTHKNFASGHCQQFANLMSYKRNLIRINFHDEEFKAFSTNTTEKIEAQTGNVFEFDASNCIEDSLKNDKIFEEISQGDPQIMKKLKLLEFEIAVLKEEHFKVPDILKKSHWMQLLETNAVCKRKKFLAFLRLNELKELKKKHKYKKKRENLLIEKQNLGFHYYGLGGQSMFLRIYKRDLNTWLHLRQKFADFCIIFDCSYQSYMSALNTRACAKQLLFCVNEAKVHPYPCKIEFFNVNRDELFGKTIPFYINKFYDGDVGDIHSGNYLEKYPKEKLVYLTPHARENLQFNADHIYIIGAFVDKGTGEKASLAKAKENGLKMAKLPLDEYVKWKKGVKALPLNIVTNILLDMAFYRDWVIAFKNLSKRKIDSINFQLHNNRNY